MNYFGRFLSNFKDFYKEINAATLTGAIDVIVVEQQDGSFQCSPFHVRFGKMGVLRSREKVVDIEINGEPVDLHMKLGETGEAFFVEETDGEIPDYLATSPIQSYDDLIEAGLKRLHVESEVLEDKEDVKIEEISVLTEDKYLIEGVAEAMKEPCGSDSVTVNIEEVSKSVEIVIETGDGETKTSHLDLSRNCSLASLSEAESEKRGMSDKCGEDDTKKKVKVLRKRRKSGKGNKSKTNNSIERCDSHSSVQSVEDIFEMEITTDDDDDDDEIQIINAHSDNHSNGHVIQCEDDRHFTHLSEIPYIPDFHPFSDGDATPLDSPIVSPRPGTPKSDTEAELQRIEPLQGQEVNMKWNWGELPQVPQPVKPTVTVSESTETADAENGATSSESTVAKETSSEAESKQKQSMLGSMFQFMRRTKKIRHSQNMEGIYLDELTNNKDELDPEVAALYLTKPTLPTNQIQPIKDDCKDEKEDICLTTADEERQSAVQSPSSLEGGEGSIDSGLESQHPFEDSSILTTPHDLLTRINISKATSTDETGEQLGDLALSLCGGLEKSEGDIPMENFLQALVTYEDFCKNPGILTDPNLVLRFGGKYYNWQSASPLIMSLVVFQRPLPENVADRLTKDSSKKEGRRLTSWFSWRRSNKPTDSIKSEEKAMSDSSLPNSLPSSPKKEASRRQKSDSSSSEEDQLSPPRQKPVKESHSDITEIGNERYRKTVRLSSDKIAKLNLKSGANEIVYSVTTQYQGTCRCKCNVYLWRYDDKIIISDIDGTITKSDVMGQILPVFGKDWTQSGVANLYTSIRKNGYQFLYLSARAIGQASLTKGYLKSVKQEQTVLPDGPLLLSPTSLITAFHKEVIERKPEEFKISCLRDIQALFPDSGHKNPFYAGFGNKINDVWAYRALDIPISRIFTINPKGELKHELTQTFQSSYTKLSDLVDHLFPPVASKTTSYEFTYPNEYSSFTYWRTPHMEIDIELTPLDDDKQKTKSSKK
ncbi:phosphatidate phosphatase LPIN2-like isoform X3 [Ptychodera flava]